MLERWHEANNAAAHTMSEVRPVRIEASWISIGLRRVPGWTRPGSLIALVAAGLMTGACTSGRSPPSAAVPARRILPVGASIGPGGYATILTAPPKPYPDAPPPPERPYGDDVEALARTLGISREEAMTRMNPDEPTLRAATSLAQRLRVEARAQFVEFKIERDP